MESIDMTRFIRTLRRFAAPRLAVAAVVLGATLVVSGIGPAPVAAEGPMRAVRGPDNVQIDLFEGELPILRYNYGTVDPPEGFVDKVSQGNRRYARPRGDYINPVYGPEGEPLTADWEHDHPHHRGIYWAWPEVDFRGERGDLHALQRVFARPTGQIDVQTETDDVQIEAESRWLWEDETPIVREVAVLRAHRADKTGRHVNLRFEFTALEEGVAIARRGTDKYGGLNVRLSPVQELEIVTHTDPVDAKPRRAWADAVGMRGGATRPSGLAIFERKTNPGYPCQWVEYPNLPWVQPTFPPAGTRHALRRDAPLVLEYRLWIHPGGRAPQETYAGQWDGYNR